MQAVRVPSLGGGRAKTLPEVVTGDKAYSSRPGLSLLRGRESKPSFRNRRTRSDTVSAAVCRAGSR
jgi:hypothetical protein